jgi:hypothetical protein
MDIILVKILAAFLALSQVATRPDAIKIAFDPAGDQAEVTQILRDGCGHMRKAFDVESLDLDDLIKTAMDDPGAISADIKALHGLKFDSLIAVYRQFCKNEEVKNSPVDLGEMAFVPRTAYHTHSTIRPAPNIPTNTSLSSPWIRLWPRPAPANAEPARASHPTPVITQCVWRHRQKFNEHQPPAARLARPTATRSSRGGRTGPTFNRATTAAKKMTRRTPERGSMASTRRLSAVSFGSGGGDHPNSARGPQQSGATGGRGTSTSPRSGPVGPG